MMISKHELDTNYPEWTVMPDGEQVAVDHTSCHAGRDTRGRMYIKRNAGMVLWHCFNCNEGGGAFVATLSPIAVAPTHLPSVRGMTTTERKLGLEWVWADGNPCSEEQYGWLKKYEMADDEAKTYQIRAVSDGLLLPVYCGGLHNITGFQKRLWPKSYLTGTRRPWSYLDPYAGEHTDKRTLVLTEDLLSHYKVHACGYASVSLLGTTLKDSLPKGPWRRVVVWLDDDAAGHAGSLRLYRELSPVVVNLNVIRASQPKELTFKEIEDRLDEL